MGAKKNMPKTRPKKIVAGEKASRKTEKTVLKALGLSGGMFGPLPALWMLRTEKLSGSDRFTTTRNMTPNNLTRGRLQRMVRLWGPS